MIYISIGTGGNVQGKGAAQYLENLEMQFETAKDAQQWLRPFLENMYFEDRRTINEVLMEGCAKGEWVDPEMEIHDKEGHYTNLFICIRGCQEVDWQALQDELTRAMNRLMLSGEYKDTPTKKNFIELLNGAYAVANAINTHAANLELHGMN